MVNNNIQKQDNQLLYSIIEGIQSKKGENILSINLKEIGSGVCDYFVVCSANSRNQSEAIAEAVERTVKTNTGERAWHKEGFENAEWILLDYINVVVHIFQSDARVFYNLEKLWGDGKVEVFNE